MLQGHEHTWFHQDGATAHTVSISIAVLRGLFLQRPISRYGDVPWPPRSPDLSASDFFFGDIEKVMCMAADHET